MIIIYFSRLGGALTLNAQCWWVVVYNIHRNLMLTYYYLFSVFFFFIFYDIKHIYIYIQSCSLFWCALYDVKELLIKRVSYLFSSAAPTDFDARTLNLYVYVYLKYTYTYDIKVKNWMMRSCVFIIYVYVCERHRQRASSSEPCIRPRGLSK